MGKRQGWARLEGKVLLINLTDNRAIRGRLVDTRDGVLTVATPRLFDPGNPSGVELDGAAHLDVARVSFAQELPPSDLDLPAPIGGGDVIG